MTWLPTATAVVVVLLVWSLSQAPPGVGHVQVEQGEGSRHAPRRTTWSRAWRRRSIAAATWTRFSTRYAPRRRNARISTGRWRARHGAARS